MVLKGELFLVNTDNLLMFCTGVLEQVLAVVMC